MNHVDVIIPVLHHIGPTLHADVEARLVDGDKGVLKPLDTGPHDEFGIVPDGGDRVGWV